MWVLKLIYVNAIKRFLILEKEETIGNLCRWQHQSDVAHEDSDEVLRLQQFWRYHERHRSFNYLRIYSGNSRYFHFFMLYCTFFFILLSLIFFLIFLFDWFSLIAMNCHWDNVTWSLQHSGYLRSRKVLLRVSYAKSEKFLFFSRLKRIMRRTSKR